jgi:DNA-binding XRE family transcriptional regulator
MYTLAEMIRTRRKERGLTLETLSELVGLTPGALSHIESGRRLPDPNNAIAIGKALGLDPDVVLAALDEAHSERRHSQVGRPRNVSSAVSALGAPRSPGSSAYNAMPIDALFSPSGVMNAAPVRSSRDLAKSPGTTAERLRALEDLAEGASVAIRTLRGMVDDADPAVAHEARRLLRELDVRGSEE